MVRVLVGLAFAWLTCGGPALAAAPATTPTTSAELRWLRERLEHIKQGLDEGREGLALELVPGPPVARKANARLVESVIGGQRFGNVNRFVVEAHAYYKDLKRSATEGDQAELGRVHRLIHDLLERRDLQWGMAALLRAGYSLADAGQDDPGHFGRSDLQAEHTSVAYVDFETPHVMDEEWPVDFSLAGRFGFAPVLALVKQRGGGGTAGSPPGPSHLLVGMYQPGLTWEAGLRANGHAAGAGEMSLVTRIGQSRLTDLVVKMGDGTDAALGDVVVNGPGRWAWAWELGCEYRYFGDSLTLTHSDRGRLLTPLLALAAGIRRDERFASEGDLAGLDGADRRWFIRFSVNALNLLERDGEAVKPGRMGNLRFSLEHERPRGPARIPSGTRILVEASADLLKLFSPRQPAEEKARSEQVERAKGGVK